MPAEPPASRFRGLLRLDWGLAMVAGLSFGAAGYVFATEGGSVALRILAEDLWLFAAILPKVALGCLIGALIRLLIARETIERFVGEGSGLLGLGLAALIGMLFPAGPFTIFPLAAVLLTSGADRGAAIAFISAWLLVGINRAIIWEMPFFGPDFVLFRFLISLPLPVLLGLLARAPVLDRIAPRTAKAPPAGNGGEAGS
ncbi:permease [Rhabdaerophilum calidifontis]|uniref:permease n=1 Tax=Rhabdaerophilum calidifontis TaxID=2604328 RepID=UPI00123BCAD8|nr:permease [Rhabdaerophilum calidifontis]